MASKKKAEGGSDGGWEAMKSGAMKHPSGWYAKEYLSGWYLYTANHQQMGPYKSFDEGVKAWTKRSDKG